MSDNGALSEVIARYLQALDAGDNPNPSEWIGRHPEHAEELHRFFAAQEKVQHLAAPLRDAVEPRLGQKAEVPAGPGLLQQTTPVEPAAGQSAAAAALPRAFGDYELLEEIGRGGMGVVFRARHVRLGRTVAVKMLAGLGPRGPDESERLKHEARILAELDDPGIVPVYEVGLHEGQHYFAMKLIEGPSLAGRLPALTGDVREGVRVVAAAARAVQHAHERGVLHRDLKPGNIVLDESGEPYLLDFGLARRADGPESLTTTGVLGTPGYMAPEQAQGCKDLTPATDVYSLGVILYELLTGELPFQGETTYETLRAIQRGRPPLPRWRNSRVSQDLEAVCLKCLEKEPQQRYASAAELAEDLRRVLDGEPVQARRVSRLRSFLRRRGRLTWLCVAALAGVLGLAGAWILPTRALVQAYAADMARAQEAHFQGNFAWFVELMDRYQQKGWYDYRDPTWNELQKKYERIRPCLLYTLEVPGSREVKAKQQVNHNDLIQRLLQARPPSLHGWEYSYNWSRDGSRIVTEWGKTHDAATGQILPAPASGTTQAALANHYREFQGKDDLFCPDESSRWFDSMEAVESANPLRAAPSHVRAAATAEMIQVRVSPDGTRVLSGVLGFRYWNVWDRAKLQRR
jgi:predicted Ser/Thr protein kinase